MKYRINKPRKLKTGKRAPYWGTRIYPENSFEVQALRQLYPTLGAAPKGRKTESETDTWLSQIRQAVERRAHLLAMGLPVGDTVDIQKRIAEYIAWGRVQGGKKGLPWGDGHAEHQEAYLDSWVQELGLKTLSDLHQGPFNAVVARLSKKFAPNTVNNRAFALLGLCSWAKSCEYIPANPVTFKALDDAPRRPRGAFSLEELRALFAGAPWERALVYRTAYFLRFRRSECWSLRVRSILWAESLADLHYKAAKDRNRALKPIPKDLLADLWTHCEGKDQEAPIFGWSKKQAAKRLHEDMAALGIPVVRDGLRRDFHSLGHSTASSMDRHRVGPGLASQFMRHKTWAETQGYINHAVEAERVISQALEDEIEHTDDTRKMEEEEMSRKSTNMEDFHEVLSESLTLRRPPASKSKASKYRKFRQLPAREKRTPRITWSKFESLVAHLRHAALAGDVSAIEAFLKLSPAQQQAALKAARRGQGAA